MKVALVYDRINKIGGAERVLSSLTRIYPEAPLFTAVYHKKRARWAKNIQIYESFLRFFPFARSHHEWYPYVTPFAFEQFDFTGFDVVISITSADAKGIITQPDTLHICYCLTPTRYLWSHHTTYFRNKLFRFISQPLVYILQKWDYLAATRPDIFISISQTVKRRVQAYYARKSLVIYPPVDIDFFAPTLKKSPKDYYLLVARLVPYKRIDIVIAAFNKLGKPLVIIGKGLDAYRLRTMAKSNISFVHSLTDQQLLEYYQNCRALIFAQEEDFGLTAVEALACGTPVIAYNKGGASEIIIDGETGVLFTQQTSAAIIQAVKSFETTQYNSNACRKSILRFARKNFEHTFKQSINTLWNNYKKGQTYI